MYEGDCKIGVLQSCCYHFWNLGERVATVNVNSVLHSALAELILLRIDQILSWRSLSTYAQIFFDRWAIASAYAVTGDMIIRASFAFRVSTSLPDDYTLPYPFCNYSALLDRSHDGACQSWSCMRVFYIWRWWWHSSFLGITFFIFHRLSGCHDLLTDR